MITFYGLIAVVIIWILQCSLNNLFLPTATVTVVCNYVCTNTVFLVIFSCHTHVLCIFIYTTISKRKIGMPVWNACYDGFKFLSNIMCEKRFRKWSLKEYTFLLLVFFSWISLPPAPKYPIRTISIFLENSRRYSQVKLHHQYQRHRRQILPQVSLVLLIPVALMGTRSGCWDLKVNLKAKMYL